MFAQACEPLLIHPTAAFFDSADTMFINVFIHSSYGICWITQSVQTLSEEAPIRRGARGLNWQQINHMPCCTSYTISDFITCAWISCQVFKFKCNSSKWEAEKKILVMSWQSFIPVPRNAVPPTTDMIIRVHNLLKLPHSDLSRCLKVTPGPPPSPSLLPLLSVSFPVQRLNGSLTPFHVEPLTEKKNHDSTENKRP